jgi:uroporphyrin-III C-methyltransferase/precorrin-2 dehydrogenase/sirohydrochlorin ferrochelatase
LTRRGVARTVTFVTPRIGDEETCSDWVTATVSADTAALYMGAGQAEAIAQALIARGLSASTPVAVVRDASLPGTETRDRDTARACGVVRDR